MFDKFFCWYPVSISASRNTTLLFCIPLVRPLWTYSSVAIWATFKNNPRKCFQNDSLPPVECALFPRFQTGYNDCMRRDIVLVHARFRNMYGLRLMRVLGPKLWNKLPNDLRVCEDYFKFKEHLKKWHSHCQCNCCLMCSLKLIWCHHFLTCT